MRYYIVVDEWNYPVESGRQIIGDYNTLEEARQAAKKEWELERENFLEISKGELYSDGEIVNDWWNKECLGFILTSSPHESECMHFVSRIIKMDGMI